MEEISRILKEHAKKYPRMQPQDAVKLLYQNEFGGGHLVRDKEACLQYLHREYASVAKDTSVPLLEDIGGGLVRVMLAAVEEDWLEKLGASFLRSAEIHRGSLERFRRKLAEKNGVMPAFRRLSSVPYESEIFLVPIEEVMLTEQVMPERYINAAGNGITEDYVNWLKPLMGQPLPEFVTFRKS